MKNSFGRPVNRLALKEHTDVISR